MNPAHVIDGIGASAPGNPTGAGRVRQPVKGGVTPVFDPIRAVAPAKSPRKSLRGGSRRKKRSAFAIHSHWSALTRLGPRGVAAGGRSGTGRGPPGPGPRRTPARGGAMPQLLRLADAGHGCLSVAVAGSP